MDGVRPIGYSKHESCLKCVPMPGEMNQTCNAHLSILPRKSGELVTTKYLIINTRWIKNKSILNTYTTCVKIHKIKFLCLKFSDLWIYKFSCLRQWKVHLVGWRNRIPMFLELQFIWYFHLEVQKSFTLAPTSCRYTLTVTAAHRDSSMNKQH